MAQGDRTGHGGAQAVSPEPEWRYMADLYTAPNGVKDESYERRLRRYKAKGWIETRLGPDGQIQVHMDPDNPDRPLFIGKLRDRVRPEDKWLRDYLAEATPRLMKLAQAPRGPDLATRSLRANEPPGVVCARLEERSRIVQALILGTMFVVGVFLAGLFYLRRHGLLPADTEE